MRPMPRRDLLPVSPLLLAVLISILRCEASEFYHDCSDAYRRGVHVSGLVEIKPGTLPSYRVFCRMDLPQRRGWTVVQRRLDGSVDFNRNLDDYRKGFGFLEGEYWIGLDRISQLTHSPYQYNTSLMVKMCTFDKECAQATYSNFKVLRGTFGYRACVTGYDSNSTAGDAMGEDAPANRTAHQQQFSTPDLDADASNSTHCARESYSGWWHSGCWLANPNGQYRPDAVAEWKGVHWLPFSNASLEFVEMRVHSEPLC